MNKTLQNITLASGMLLAGCEATKPISPEKLTTSPDVTRVQDETRKASNELRWDDKSSPALMNMQGLGQSAGY